MRTRQLVAFNTATQSDNKIHDDDVARRFGFSGGLVPGVDVYAYLCWGPVADLGPGLAGAGHDGRPASACPPTTARRSTVTFDEADGACRGHQRGRDRGRPPGTCPAAGHAVGRGRAGPGAYPWAPRPDDAARPAASPEVLTAGTVLGSWDVTFERRARPGRTWPTCGRSCRSTPSEGIAHPGWVLRLANRILSGNVVLGPWIHVGSAVRHHGLVHDGAKVSCRGTVAEEYERKGHRFVRLDLGVAGRRASSWPPSTTPPSTCPARSPPPADRAGGAGQPGSASASAADDARGRRRPASRPPRRAAVPRAGSGSPPSPR